MKDSEQTETTVADKIANETVKDEQEVLDATTKRLKETFSEKEEDQDTADAPEEQEDPTPESKVETEADEPESKEDSTPEPDKEEKGLPEAYVRSAVHQGWTEEKVQAFFKADPEGSLEILKNIHDSNNKLTETFSNLGRKAMESTSIPGPKEKTEIKPLVDIDKLREQYDGDPLLEVIEAINKAHAEQTAILSQRPTGQAQVDPVKEQADAMIIQQVDNFWTSDVMNKYKSFYGKGTMGEKDVLQMTGEQQNRRWKVLREADLIMAGARVRGQDMDVNQALERAHLLVSEPERERVVRSELKSAVTKRAKGVVLAPSSSSKKTEDTSGKQMSAKELEAKTAERLRKVFG